MFDPPRRFSSRCSNSAIELGGTVTFSYPHDAAARTMQQAAAKETGVMRIAVLSSGALREFDRLLPRRHAFATCPCRPSSPGSADDFAADRNPNRFRSTSNGRSPLQLPARGE